MTQGAARFIGAFSLRAALCFLVAVGIAGCGTRSFTFRVSLESSLTQPPEARVFVERSDGLALTGCAVLMEIPGSEALLLGYNGDKGCFTGSAQAFLSGDYAFTVRSALSEEERSVVVPHTILREGPSIIDITDESGASARAGAALNPAEALAFRWDPIDNATAYQILVYSAGEVIVSSSSSDPMRLLDAGILPEASTISVCVSAQWISGDPLYEAQDYSSVSCADGPTFSFSTR